MLTFTSNCPFLVLDCVLVESERQAYDNFVDLKIYKSNLLQVMLI